MGDDIISNKREMILRHLRKQLENSMLGYEVNGNPVKRHFTLMNIARVQFDKLTEQQMIAIISQIDPDQL